MKLNKLTHGCIYSHYICYFLVGNW